MSKLLTAALLLFCCLPTLSSAQSVWRHFERPDLGGSFIMYDYEENGRITTDPGSEESYEDSFLHLGLHAGFNLPFVPLGEDMAIGLNPAFGVAVASRSSAFRGESKFVSLEVPWYATLKVGGDASYKGSKFPLGLTLGIGYHYSYVFSTITDFAEGVSAPSLMAELCIGKRKSWGLFKIRYTQDLGSHTIDHSDPSADIEHTLDISRAGVHILYVVGF